MFQNECEPISSRGIYLTGCFQAMLDEIETNSAIVGGVAIGVLVVMVSINEMEIQLRLLCVNNEEYDILNYTFN